MSPRYTLREFAGSVAIKDNHPDAIVLLYGVGHAVGYEAQAHRRLYTRDDAQALCDWLNERDQGYPVPEGIRLWEEVTP